MQKATNTTARSRIPLMVKIGVAVAVASALTLGSATVLPSIDPVEARPAIAPMHTATPEVVVQCVSGKYVPTYTVTLTNVPSGATAEVSARNDTVKQDTWNYATWSDWQVKASNVPSTQKTVTWQGEPFSADEAPKFTYIYTAWYSGSTKNYEEKKRVAITLPSGDCNPPIVPLPPDHQLTCDAAILQPGRALVNGDHINLEIVQNGRTFQANAYVDKNHEATTPDDFDGYNGLGVRIQVDGVTVGFFGLSEVEVKTGILSFNFRQYLTGFFQSPWGQFNSWYFNQDRQGPPLECGDPVVVTPVITYTPPTCIADGTIVATDTDQYTWTGPEQRQDGSWFIATAKPGFTLTKTDFGAYNLGKLDPTDPECYTPPTVVTPTLTVTDPTCTAAGSIVAVDTDQYEWTPSGSESARVYTASPIGNVTLTQKDFGPYNLVQLNPVDNPTECPPVVLPAKPEAAITSTCLADGGASITFIMSNIVTQGPGTVGSPALFTTKVDGTIKDEVTVNPGTTTDRTHSFAEDSGIYVGQVWSDGKLLAEKSVSSDCLDIEVTPVAPTFKQPTCDTPGKLTVPTQPEGVNVVVDGLKVTFSPKPGYFFPANTKTEHTFVEVKPTGCDKPTPPPVPPAALTGTGSEPPTALFGIALTALLLGAAAMATAVVRKRRS